MTDKKLSDAPYVSNTPRFDKKGRRLKTLAEALAEEGLQLSNRVVHHTQRGRIMSMEQARALHQQIKKPPTFRCPICEVPGATADGCAICGAGPNG